MSEIGERRVARTWLCVRVNHGQMESTDIAHVVDVDVLGNNKATNRTQEMLKGEAIFSRG